MHREEVHLVLAVCDQVQLFADLRLHLLWRALRVNALHAHLHQPGQGLRGGHASGHGLQRVLVLDFVQGERAAPRHGERGVQQLGRIDARQPHAPAQMALGIGLQRKPAFAHAAAQAYGGDHILQRLARTGVHVHIARCHQRQAQRRTHTLQRGQPQAVVRGQVQFDRQPDMAIKI